VHAWGGSVKSLKKNTKLLEGLTLWSPPAVANRRPLGWTSSEKIWSPACRNHIGFSTIIVGVVLTGGSFSPRGGGPSPQLWQSFCFCQMMGLTSLNPPVFSLTQKRVVNPKSLISKDPFFFFWLCRRRQQEEEEEEEEGENFKKNSPTTNWVITYLQLHKTHKTWAPTKNIR
jgi:hypothetical protein